MEKSVLESYISKGNSIRNIASEENVSGSTVRYWLNKYGIKTFKYQKQIELKHPKKCKCGETRPDKFYGNKRTICGKCHNKYTTIKGEERKTQAVKYLGGKCKECGYNKCIQALDIHHVDSSKKDISFKYKRSWGWERLKKELKGCILLCANCHRELHSK